MKVFLQPCGNKHAQRHFETTVRTPVPITRLISKFSTEDVAALGPLFEGRSAIPVWGIKPGPRNLSYWNDLAIGDIGLFGGDKTIFASAVVAAKVHSSSLGRELWGENGDQTWEYIYLLDEVSYLNVKCGDFHRLVRYPGPNADNWTIQNFGILNDDRSARAAEGLDLWSRRHPSSEASLSIAVPTSLLNADGLDLARTTATRREQSFLRSSLFGDRQIAQCCICHKTYPVDLLTTAHLKRRALCTDVERLDVKNVVAAMCVTGCDSFYERGYIVIDEKGVIRQGRTDLQTDELRALLASIVGRPCRAWRSQTEPYFAAHRRAHTDDVRASLLLPMPDSSGDRERFATRALNTIRATSKTILTSAIEERPPRIGSVISGRVYLVDDKHVAICTGQRTFSILDRKTLSRSVNEGESIKVRIGVTSHLVQARAPETSQTRTLGTRAKQFQTFR